MRFDEAGPDIPNELVADQERGAVVFLCGAGVSVNAGLPNFRGLVEQIYASLGESWRDNPIEFDIMEGHGPDRDQFDRVLRCLERRLSVGAGVPPNSLKNRIRDAVRNALKVPVDKGFDEHRSILRLSCTADQIPRVLTTNFDTIFERAAFIQNGTSIRSYAGAAMPQPNSAEFEGILHIHGRLRDDDGPSTLEETDLVLTSAEFGEAYLRSGWASRYVYDLVRTNTLVLIGYRANDPPMRYLLEVLEADRQRFTDLRKIYAFDRVEAGNEEAA